MAKRNSAHNKAEQPSSQQACHPFNAQQPSSWGVSRVARILPPLHFLGAAILFSFCVCCMASCCGNIYLYTTTQCNLPKCKCSICASGWMKKCHQRKLQRVNHHVCEWTICASGCKKKHHHYNLQLVTTITCASGMVTPVGETPQAQGAKVRASISASQYGLQHNMQFQPPPPTSIMLCS